jgi:putative ABC transport system substrate-binding protein
MRLKIVTSSGYGQRSNSDLTCKRWHLWIVGLLLIGMSLFPRDLSYAKRARPVLIGALSDSWGPTSGIVGLRDGLVTLGYRENQDFVLGVRFTQGDHSALPEAAQELIQAGAELLFADSNVTAKAVQQATRHMPIIFVAVEDPVGSGLVRSFAQPGGNITGVDTLDIELGPKRLQVFQELVPSLKRVLFLYDATDIYAEQAATLYQSAARRLGMTLVTHVVRTQDEARDVLSQLQPRHIDGILAPRCWALNIPGLILDASKQQQMPTMYTSKAFWMEASALTSYGSDFHASGVQAARLVDKILKGDLPANIPVEVNSTIEFSINLHRAQALGLTLDPVVLSQADSVRQ